MKAKIHCSISYHVVHTPPLSLVGNMVISGNEYSVEDGERVVYGRVLDSFTFDLLIITIGFTFSDLRPLSQSLKFDCCIK